MKKILPVILFIILVGAIAIKKLPAPPLPTLGNAPHFVLTSSQDKSFSSSSLVGNVWVANFFLTSCEGPCPIQSSQLAKLVAQFKNQRVRFVSISVDPDTDTPEVLQKYAHQYNADHSTWHFLTGKMDTILGLINTGFNLGTLDNPVNHSTRFILVDQNSLIRGYYHGTDTDSVTQLATDIENLL